MYQFKFTIVVLRVPRCTCTASVGLAKARSNYLLHPSAYPFSSFLRCDLPLLLSRETLEECGLTVTELDKVGVIVFEFVDDPQLLEVHVYRTEQYSGEVTETEGAYITCVLNYVMGVYYVFYGI